LRRAIRLDDHFDNLAIQDRDFQSARKHAAFRQELTKLGPWWDEHYQWMK
jgi:hypothetical protein